SIGQHGKTTQGMLVVGFTNPDPNAREADRHFTLGFSCGGGTTAMCRWECMGSHMEIGPEAGPHLNDLENPRHNWGRSGPLRVVCFPNPDPSAREAGRPFPLGFSCGGGTTAMCLWEGMRSYMEIGPEAVPHLNDLDNLRENLGGKGPFWGAWWTYYLGIRDHLK